MEAYNQNLLNDVFYHLHNLKQKITHVKLNYNRDRDLVNTVDDLLKTCDLIQFIIQSYDSYNVRHLCNIINNSFADPNSHGIIAIITKKRYADTFDRGRLDFIHLAV